MSKLRKILAWTVLSILGSVLLGQESINQHEDAISVIESGFPKSIVIKNRGKLIEFCPDNTCDGFVGSAHHLKDFAYLWIYYFSDFAYLDDWRRQQAAGDFARRLLSKQEYLACKRSYELDSARCVLRMLNNSDKIDLLFIRYDEKHRTVVRQDTKHELDTH